jgi:hypothetical protein
MKLKDIKSLDNASLLTNFYLMGIKTTKETNSPRGLTKKTLQEETWIIEEVEKRFNLELKEKLLNL